MSDIKLHQYGFCGWVDEALEAVHPGRAVGPKVSTIRVSGWVKEASVVEEDA